MSVAKIFGVIPLFLLAGLGIMLAGEKEAAFGGVFMMIFAFLAPIIYGAMGFVMGALMAWIYNLIAKRFGGIKVELQPVQPVSNLGLV